MLTFFILLVWIFLCLIFLLEGFSSFYKDKRPKLSKFLGALGIFFYASSMLCGLIFLVILLITVAM